MDKKLKRLFVELGKICDGQDERATISGSAKGASITAMTAFVGGLLLGPVGLAIGGTIGAVISYINGDGTFRPLISILMEMPDSKKEELFRKIQHALRSYGALNVPGVIALIHSNQEVVDIVRRVVFEFLSSNMNVK